MSETPFMSTTERLMIRDEANGGSSLTIAASVTVDDADQLHGLAFKSLEKSGPVRVIFEERVEHVHGAALQVLLCLKQSCKRQGRGFAVSAPSGNLREMLSVLGLRTG